MNENLSLQNDIDNSYLSRDPSTWKPVEIAQALRGFLKLSTLNPDLLAQTCPNLGEQLKNAINSRGGIVAVDELLKKTQPGHMLLSELFQDSHVDPDSIFPRD